MQSPIPTYDLNVMHQLMSRGELSFADVERLARHEAQALADADPGAALRAYRVRPGVAQA